MQSRDQMHAAQKEGRSSPSPITAKDVSATPKTDSARMFELGVQGGKPRPGARGTSPEWFYKGDGGILRGHRDALDIPAFALDGGEEPEIVGCYVIDPSGQPRRLGFALGNEWSDHATEAINYLYLAPSKLRTCAIGPTLNTDCDFQDIPLRCTVEREGRTIYDSGELRTGEKWMCHSLRNLEDHHFKYAQHRRPGDIHLHFFGTSKLSHKTRDWRFQAGDEIRIESPLFSAALVNHVAAGSPGGRTADRGRAGVSRMTQRTVIVGGGLAGLAAAVALAQRRMEVTVLESRPRLGGRASSFVDKASGTQIDNCQHVSLGCCTNFQHFCRTVGLADLFRTESELFFIGSGQHGEPAVEPVALPAPFHCLGSFGQAELPVLPRSAADRVRAASLRGRSRGRFDHALSIGCAKHRQTRRRHRPLLELPCW